MRTKNQFGRVFKQVRIKKGRTQEDFAPLSGRTYLSEIERGLKHPTLKKIDELAEPLGVHPLTPLFISYLHSQDEQEIRSLLDLIFKEVLEVLDDEQPGKANAIGDTPS